MKIKKDANVSSGDFWYDLTDGGYLRPEEICENQEDAKKVIEAVKIVKEFQESLVFLNTTPHQNQLEKSVSPSRKSNERG